MQGDIRYEDHHKLILYTAHRVSRRIYNLGTSAQFDDIVQELSIAWCIARDKFDPSLQVPFKAWLMRGMIQHINRWVGKEVLNHNSAHIDLDADIEEGTNAHDVIADESKIDAETSVVRKTVRNRNLNRLSAEARQFVELLENPPLSLVQALRALKDRAEYAKSRGVATSPISHRITSAMVFDLMGVDTAARGKIYRQIEETVNKR